jgi:GNAT superfamily N-acetyltransferase
VEIRALRETDDRSGFSSGDPDIDRFFSLYAGQNQFRHHVGVTYVAVEARAISGFVTVSACSIDTADLPARSRKRLPRYPLPALRVARLGVDQAAQGAGVGAALLRFAFGLARQMERDVGCVGVVVDAKPGAVAFYEQLGFFALETEQGDLRARPRPTAMFLPLSRIA